MGISPFTIKEALKKERIFGKKSGKLQNDAIVIDLTTEGPRFLETSSHTRDINEIFRRYDTDQELKRQMGGSGPVSASPEEGKPEDGTPKIEGLDLTKPPRNINEARLHTEMYRALQAKLDYEKANMTLIEIAPLTVALEGIALTLQKSVMAIPDRMSSLFGANKEERLLIRKKMAEECRAILVSTIDAIKNLQPS